LIKVIITNKTTGEKRTYEFSGYNLMDAFNKAESIYGKDNYTIEQIYERRE